MTASCPLPPRSLLFLPATNPRAVARAATLHADLVILDLEDAVPAAAKDAARKAAVAALAGGLGGRRAAVRVNAVGDPEHPADLAALAGVAPDYLVLPKAEDAAAVAAVAAAARCPLLAMIETPAGVLSAAAIAAVPGIHGLLAGTNDLKVALGIPAGSGRAGLSLALQTVVLAARAAGAWAFDGVFNRLDDLPGFVTECGAGRAFGFDGKSLIHPDQVEPCNAAFAPDDREVEDAHALIAAATGGAERFRGRMIEGMHVAQARAVVARSGQVGVSTPDRGLW